MPGVGAIFRSTWVRLDCLYELPDPRRAAISHWFFGEPDGPPVAPETLTDDGLLTEEEAGFLGGQSLRGELAATTQALAGAPEDPDLLAERNAAYLALHAARERYTAACAEVNARPTIARDTDEKRRTELERLHGLSQ